MTLGRFAEILCTQAETYCKSSEYRKIVSCFSRRRINTTIVYVLIMPFLGHCLPILPHDTHWRLVETLEKWVPDALASIHRNAHMNNAKGRHTLNQDAADALLVDYINRACIPMDLGLYTKHVRRRKNVPAKAK